MNQGNHNMLALSRRQAIVEMVNKRGMMTVAEICQQFSVSSATARSDLRELSEQRLLERTHGGAISCSYMQAAFELDMQQKQERFSAQKTAIAALALEQISDGDTIALDTGTTTYELAKMLRKHDHLTVVSTDLQICMWLELNTNINIVMIGGPVRHGFHCTSGVSAISAIEEMHFDKVFLAANGVTVDRGMSTPSIDVAAVKKAMLLQSKSRFLLADSSKLGHDTFAIFGKLTELDKLITDDGAPADFVRRAQAAGVDVIQAKASSNPESQP